MPTCLSNTVSFFTTPDDLQARILHDLPELLQSLGAEVQTPIGVAETDIEVRNQFQVLLRLFTEREITIEFVGGPFESVDEDRCIALGLEVGATLECWGVVFGTGTYNLAVRDNAIGLLGRAKSSIRTRARLAFGSVKRSVWSEDGPMTKKEYKKGVVISEIIDIQAHEDAPTESITCIGHGF